MVLDSEIKFWESIVFAVSYLLHYDTLLQNVRDVITKCGRYFITKCDKGLLQNGSSVILQNATVLLQNATFITKSVGTDIQVFLLIHIYVNSALNWSVWHSQA